MSSVDAGTAPAGTPANRDGAGETTEGERLEQELKNVNKEDTSARERNAKEPLDTEFDERIFERLEALLQSPEFLERLRKGHKESEEHKDEDDPPNVSTPDGSEDSFVMVTKDDAMEGLVYTIALTVMSCPEAQDVNPAELQSAIVKAFQELKNSKAKSAWGWCKFIYRVTSWSYAAFSMYANPWIVRALITAFWSIPRLFSRFFV